MESAWPTLALYWYAPHAATTLPTPSSAGRSAFYLFRLPAWQLIAGWLLNAGRDRVRACRAVSACRRRRARARRTLRRSFPALARRLHCRGFLLLTLSIHEYVGRFQLLFEHHTIFDGVTYTDAHVTLTGMLFVAAALAIGAVIAIAAASFSHAYAGCSLLSPPLWSAS